MKKAALLAMVLSTPLILAAHADPYYPPGARVAPADANVTYTVAQHPRTDASRAHSPLDARASLNTLEAADRDCTQVYSTVLQSVTCR